MSSMPKDYLEHGRGMLTSDSAQPLLKRCTDESTVKALLRLAGHRQQDFLQLLHHFVPV